MPELPPTVTEWPAAKVRDTFISFFEAKEHVNWVSSPVVPLNDPTLLFANAVQTNLLGTADPNTPLSKLTRAWNTQKCIRAGGKHNDLDDVGKDTYHHTFFEMLGNWSFGDYFKREAIEWAWELLTEVYKLPTDRFYATYFGGDEQLGLAPDDEARDIWLKFLPLDMYFHLVDNFWEMGDTGPCGPCTEIHFDRIGNRDATSLVNNDDPTCIEIWNLVFIQFNRESDGSLKPLPAKHVDTGLGFERLTSILQNKMSNYDTDVFLPIFDAIHLATGAPLYSGKVGTEDVDKVDMAYRVVADHIRTLSFAIADGSCPGNEGREYVLRRILRRAVRYGSEVLKAQEGFFNGLVGVVVKVMGDVFPELKQHEMHIRGIEKFKKAAQEEAFVLWDTYGFPLDLTQLMAEERGLTVDVTGFNIAMDEARERSRNAQNKKAGGAIVMDADATAALHKMGLLQRMISASLHGSRLVDELDHESVIKAIYTGTEFLESAAAGDEVGIILETTSFYAEQGGQIFDTGSLEGSCGSFQVCNVQIYGGFVLHIGSVTGEIDRFSVGDKVICKVDYDRRKLIAPNHTCTHMLNFALREVLGNHVDQKGSIVLPEKLRFDFSHGKPIHPDHLRRIESIVNDQIKDELDVYGKEATLADAKRINGLRAVFGEIYPDPVRVVTIGRKVEDLLADPDNAEWLSGPIYQIHERLRHLLFYQKRELLRNRRITAVTTDGAFKAMELAFSLEQEVDAASDAEGSLLEKKVASLRSRVDAAPIPHPRKLISGPRFHYFRKEQKKIAEENTQKAVKAATEMADGAASDGKAFCISLVDVGLDTTAVREAVLKVIEQKGISVMVFSTDETTNKAVVYAGVPENGEKFKQLEVSEWLTAALGPLKGRCGKGKGGLAQGQEAMDVATKFASMKLS
ncbi:hypothetical protein AAG906_016555 [Vitis piasezkii]